MEATQNIDFSKTVNTDDVELVLDELRGVIVLLQTLVIADDTGSFKNQKHAYNVLSNTCSRAVEDLKEMIPKIDYMDDLIRGK